MSKFRVGINKYLRKFRYQLIRIHKPDLFNIIFSDYLEKHDRRARVVQIGANDGVRFDPLHGFLTNKRFALSGIVVEPIPRFYKALQKTYSGNKTITPLNLAIHNTETEASIFAVAESCENSVPEWVKGIASFDRDHLVRAGISEDCIEEIKVPCRSLAKLCAQYQIMEIDLLQIDTEGYDSEIILGLDFNSLKPKMIHFEHGLRDNVMTPEKFKMVLNYLNQHGYQVVMESYDALAVLTLE